MNDLLKIKLEQDIVGFYNKLSERSLTKQLTYHHKLKKILAAKFHVWHTSFQRNHDLTDLIVFQIHPTKGLGQERYSDEEDDMWYLSLHFSEVGKNITYHWEHYHKKYLENNSVAFRYFNQETDIPNRVLDVKGQLVELLEEEEFTWFAYQDLERLASNLFLNDIALFKHIQDNFFYNELLNGRGKVFKRVIIEKIIFPKYILSEQREQIKKDLIDYYTDFPNKRWDMQLTYHVEILKEMLKVFNFQTNAVGFHRNYRLYDEISINIHPEKGFVNEDYPQEDGLWVLHIYLSEVGNYITYDWTEINEKYTLINETGFAGFNGDFTVPPNVLERKNEIQKFFTEKGFLMFPQVAIQCCEEDWLNEIEVLKSVSYPYAPTIDELLNGGLDFHNHYGW